MYKKVWRLKPELQPFGFGESGDAAAKPGYPSEKGHPKKRRLGPVVRGLFLERMFSRVVLYCHGSSCLACFSDVGSRPS